MSFTLLTNIIFLEPGLSFGCLYFYFLTCLFYGDYHSAKQPVFLMSLFLAFGAGSWNKLVYFPYILGFSGHHLNLGINFRNIYLSRHLLLSKLLWVFLRLRLSGDTDFFYNRV